MHKDSLDYLRHISDECVYIKSVITSEISKSNFLENETLKRAVIRSLEIIGEASKKISADLKYRWDTVSWKNMAGMRDRLIHDYMGVDYSIVWDVVKNKIPELYEQIEDVIEGESKK